MKKTMIALVALSGLAMADTTTTSYADMLATSSDWTQGSARGRSDTLSFEDGVIYNTTGNWAQLYAIYTFETPLVLKDAGDKVDFSFVVSSQGNTNTCATLTLADTTASKVVFSGLGSYNDDPGAVKYGTGAVRADNFYSAQNSGGGSGTIITMGATGFKTVIGSIAVSESGDVIASFGENMTMNLGTSFTVDKLVISIDGSTTSAARIGNLNVVYTDVTPVPEPATATLSLLALAGLAARRRRH